MNMQHVSSSAHAPAGGHATAGAGQPLSVSPWPGELTVVDGRVWLTRRGDAADHVLEAGAAAAPAAGDAARRRGLGR